MTRKKEEIIKELSETQSLCDRLIMQIGQGYADFARKKDESLIATVNGKIETLQKAEARLNFLESELAKTAE